MAFCHGLQSLFDPLQVNSEAIKVRPASDSSDYLDSVFKGSHGWNSLNFLCSPAKESAFPPPAICTKQRLVKSFNLDMCTETLGCETGAMCTSYDQFEIASAKKKKKKKKNLPPLSTIEVTKQRSAPPPLTTLSGERRLSLGRKQGGGRLMLFPFKPPVLEAERSGGRLQLRFFRREGMNKTEGRGREVAEEEEEEEDEAKESGCFLYGCGEKQKQAGRCKEEDDGIFNRDSDARWVASS